MTQKYQPQADQETLLLTNLHSVRMLHAGCREPKDIRVPFTGPGMLQYRLAAKMCPLIQY